MTISDSDEGFLGTQDLFKQEEGKMSIYHFIN